MDETSVAKAQVANEIGVATTDVTVEETLREYALIPENAVPVPKGIGIRFQKRYDDTLRALRETVHKDWIANIKAFNETGTVEDSVDRNAPQENIVRTTVETLVDFTYMQNPSVELSSVNEEVRDFAGTLTTALTNLVNRRSEINLRPLIVQQMVMSHLTNAGCLLLEFQPREGSRQAAAELFDQVQKAILKVPRDDQEQLGRYYQVLAELHDLLESRRDFGVSIRQRSPFSIVLDPECTDIVGLSDCKWLMDIEPVKQEVLLAKYFTRDDEGKYWYRYDQSKCFDDETDTQSNTHKTKLETQIIEKLMPERDEEMAKLAVEDTILVVTIYDRATRYKYVYMDGQWETPLWVYEDTLGLSRFFQHFFLSFSTPISGALQPGVVSRYLPFQEEINRIYEQESLVRDAAFTTMIYNTDGIDKENIDKIMSEATTRRKKRGLRAIGVKLRDKDKTLSDVFAPLQMPVSQFGEVFAKDGLRQAIQQTSRISEAMKGSEYKTHTTTDAVQMYAETAQKRTEGITERIEDAAEELFWALCEIVVSKFDRADIQRLTSPGMAEHFQNMTVTEFNEQFTLTIAAGSMEKPTTQNKKKEALTLLQVLGQFGTAAPMTTLSVVFRMIRTAFSRTLIADADLQKLEQEGVAAMQKGVSTAPQQPQ